MALHDLGRTGSTQNEPDLQEKTEHGRQRRWQAFVLMMCATACWGLVALLYYCVSLTETYWPWSG
jgi:hypothetical protein